LPRRDLTPSSVDVKSGGFLPQQKNDAFYINWKKLLGLIIFIP